MASPNFSELCAVTRRWFGRRTLAPAESQIFAVLPLHPSEAEDRARELLRSWLTPEQREEYDRDWFFHVRGGTTGTKYRLRDFGKRNESHWYNVDEYALAATIPASYEIKHKLCFGPKDHNRAFKGGWQLPAGDVLLTQKIALEQDEGNVLETANRTTFLSDVAGVLQLIQAPANIGQQGQLLPNRIVGLENVWSTAQCSGSVGVVATDGV